MERGGSKQRFSKMLMGEQREYHRTLQAGSVSRIKRKATTCVWAAILIRVVNGTGLRNRTILEKSD